MSDKTEVLEELTNSAKENQQGAYLTMLEEALLEGITYGEIAKAYQLSGTVADFDEHGDSIARGVERKVPVYNTSEFPVSRENLLSNLSYLALHDEHKGYLTHLSEAQNRLIPDIEIYNAHSRGKLEASRGKLEASFDYLGALL